MATSPTLNLAGSWGGRRLEVRGFGKARFGVSPFGAKASGFNLRSTTWRDRHLEMRGFGKARFGTGPFGSKASGFNLDSAPWSTPSAADSLSGSWVESS